MTRLERTSPLLAAEAKGPAAGRVKGKDDFLEQLQSKPLQQLEASIASLTHQERVVLEFIVRGACNKDICNTLNIEITTAKAHTSRIFKKLGVKNRVQAAVFGLWTTLLARATAVDAAPATHFLEAETSAPARANTALASGAIRASALPQ